MSIIIEEDGESTLTFSDWPDESIYMTGFKSNYSDSLHFTDMEVESSTHMIDVEYLEHLEPCKNDWWHDFLELKKHNAKNSPLVEKLKGIVKEELGRLKKPALISIVKDMISRNEKAGSVLLDPSYRNACKLLMNIAKARKILVVESIVSMLL